MHWPTILQSQRLPNVILIKLITKNLSYCNIDKWIEKLFAILWEISDNK